MDEERWPTSSKLPYGSLELRDLLVGINRVHPCFSNKCNNNERVTVSASNLNPLGRCHVPCKDQKAKFLEDMIEVNVQTSGVVDQPLQKELRRNLVNELEKLLPPPITVPDRRLEHLVERVVGSKIYSCIYHNSMDPVLIYKDHFCGRDKIPTKTIQILSDHKNEVWFVQFSRNGDYLASSSSDCTTIIWKCNQMG
ncbi:unnamed protein product [Lactuca saligna]|uniref:Uncharacterized protein n=1 Tax=Lactuca saligna TaxID=75948 RepID=A0AA36E9K2_LACSI|nr:unnamed protein product [Lactuca saligna]